MRISWFVVLGLFTLLLSVAGCSATVSVDTCSTDSTVACPGGTGYTCTGSATPADTACTAGSGGTYCCGAVVIPTSCAPDTTVTGCSTPSTGYSCTSTDAPDQSDPTLSCSVGVAGNAGSTLYCCLSGEDFKVGTCAPDQTVNGCADGSYGFSCVGSDTPDQTDSSLRCSTGVAGNAGSTLFCCTAGGTTTTDTCATDTTVTCATGDTGYSCTGTAVPPTSAGTCTAGAGGAFCCSTGTTVVIPTSCSTDSTVTGCASPSTGYSCTSTDAPDQSDPTLSCSIGIPGNAGSTLYCCLSGQDFAAGTCAPDQTVNGCTDGSYGFSCASSDTPDQTDSTLTCSTGVAGNAGSTLFCCVTTTTLVLPSTCAADSTVNGCSSPSTGYSCTSTDTPDQGDPTLVCSTGVAGNAGSTLYCCLTGETFLGTCAEDNTVSGCQAGSYGFSCVGSDTPDQTDSSLTCSTGVAGNAGSTLFCCQ